MIDHIAASRVNMIETYTRIGSSAPDAEVLSRPWGIMCRSSTLHPVGNFAIVERVDTDSIADIAEFAHGRSNYFVYSFTGFEFEPDERPFDQNGFKHSSMLTSMVLDRPSRPRDPAGIELIEATLSGDRLEASRFMISQFFPRHGTDARSIIALSTAMSGVPIYRIESNGRLVGAMMLAENADTVGVYNFCISESSRGKGFGSSAIRSIESKFEPESKQICLQCDPTLVEWYENLGFSGIEHVDAWSLDYSHSVAIIGERGTNGPG